jgi:3',5'-cyclic AMP phosphodiesterase CpdA
MSVLLHISDTHFGTEQPQVLEALVALSVQQQPDVVVLSGDITQRAEPAQFHAAAAFTRRLGAPVVAIPGNHDVPLFHLAARLLSPYARYSAAFGADLEPVYASSDLLVVCVNTTRRYRHIHGELSDRQIDRVARLLSNARPEQLRVVVVHQPIAVVRAEDAHNLLRGHALAQQYWAVAGADLVLGGHIHLPYVMQVPDVARPMWVVQAGTAVSRRVRPGVPNSINIVRWKQGKKPSETPLELADDARRSCIVEQWDFDAGRETFHRMKATQMYVARSTAQT